MTTTYDPDAGVLRVGHAALSVLARLAVAPTHPSLTDHATAPPLAELRQAGILGPAGIDPAVRPLAEVVGAPAATLHLLVEGSGGVWRCRGWATGALLVLGVPAPDEHEAYDLVADAPAQASALLSELLGLPSGPAAPLGPVAHDGGSYADLLADGGPAAELPGAPRFRWEIAVRGASEDVVELVDLGDAGLWRAAGSADGRVVLTPTDAAAVRAGIDAMVSAALR
jgi:hypothetical protein